MDRNEILNIISGLAKSQGCWGRLLNRWNELYENDYDAYDEMMSELEGMNFKNGLDLVMFLEGNY